jgi:hypothetical protein
MTVRPLAFYGVIASMLCVYCTRTIGGTFPGQGSFSDGEGCSQSSECASFDCNGGICVAPPKGKAEIDAPCNTDADCISVATCNSGVCIQAYPGQSSGTGIGGSITGTGGSGPGCLMSGQDCSGGATCCVGYFCDTSGAFTCVSNGCSPTSNSCNVDSDCCSGSCDSFSLTCN